MLSFHGEACLKDAVVARVREHQRLDQIIQGTYWDGTRGCAIGCVLHSGEHMAYETQLGLPVFLAYMDEHIFESLPPKEAVLWPLRFIEAVPVGVDLELVFPRFMHWILSDPAGVRQYADAQTVPIIDGLVAMYVRRIEGIPFNIKAARAAEAAGAAEAARAAEAAAWAAEAAEAARAAEAAAWAAEAAEAAWAAEAAEAAEAARAAAWAAGAVGMAEAAAWAAGAAAGAAGKASWAAGKAAIHRQADCLIALLQTYDSHPILVLSPCEDRHIIETYLGTGRG